MSQYLPAPAASPATGRSVTFRIKPSVWLVVVCLVGLLTACTGNRATPYQPPTAIGESTVAAAQPVPATQAGQAELPASTATLECSNNLTYQADLTVPDGSQVAAGSILDKRWKVQNSGSCNWDKRYRVKLISGPELGAQEQALFPARSGTELTIQIIFTAPNEPGTYQSAWQAHDPQGNPFGDPFYIQFVVQNP